jgi:hypothetical protein
MSLVISSNNSKSQNFCLSHPEHPLLWILGFTSSLYYICISDVLQSLLATVQTGVFANLSNKIAKITGKLENVDEAKNQRVFSRTGCVTDQIGQPHLALPTNVSRRPLDFWPHLHSPIFATKGNTNLWIECEATKALAEVASLSFNSVTITGIQCSRPTRLHSGWLCSFAKASVAFRNSSQRFLWVLEISLKSSEPSSRKSENSLGFLEQVQVSLTLLD